MTPGNSRQPRCACPGCFRALQPGMLFCTEHWNVLPRELRDGIYKAQRRPERAASAKLTAVQWLEQNIQTRRVSNAAARVAGHR